MSLAVTLVGLVSLSERVWLVILGLARVQEGHQPTYQQNEHDRVQNQATKLGQALGCRDPATRDAPDELVSFWVRDGDKSESWYNVIYGCHL